MERAQIVVVAAALAVAVGVGVKILGERAVIDTGFESGPDGLQADPAVPGGGAHSASGRPGGGLGGASGASQGAGAVRDGGGGRRPGWVSGGLADAVSDSAERHASRGRGVGGAAARRVERRAGPLGGGAPEGGRRATDNSEILDFLGSSGEGQPGADAPAEEVALEVLNTDDSSKAVYREGVFEPEDGGEGIKFTEHAQLTFEQAGGASGEAGTITFDVEPDWAGNDPTDNSFVQIRAENQWANRLQLVKNGRYLRFILSDSFGREADISVPIDEWVPGESHSLTASWGDGRTSLFVDGRLAGMNTYEGEFEIGPNTPLHLGSDFRSSDYGGASATIRGFRLFTTAQHP
jgi:hypothetical protein